MLVVDMLKAFIGRQNAVNGLVRLVGCRPVVCPYRRSWLCRRLLLVRSQSLLILFFRFHPSTPQHVDKPVCRRLGSRKDYSRDERCSTRNLRSATFSTSNKLVWCSKQDSLKLNSIQPHNDVPVTIGRLVLDIARYFTMAPRWSPCSLLQILYCLVRQCVFAKDIAHE